MSDLAIMCIIVLVVTAMSPAAVIAQQDGDVDADGRMYVCDQYATIEIGTEIWIIVDWCGWVEPEEEVEADVDQGWCLFNWGDFGWICFGEDSGDEGGGGPPDIS